MRLLNKLLSLNLSGMGSERGISRLGSFVEAYYSEKEVAKPPGLIHFSASFDGKGVPKKELRQDNETTKECQAVDGVPGHGPRPGIIHTPTVNTHSTSI